MRLDQFCEITRSHGTRHLHAIAEIFEANIATYADGAPLPWKICEQQNAEAMRAIETLRAIVCQPVLEANSRALAGRLRQGSTKGRPANASAKAMLY